MGRRRLCSAGPSGEKRSFGASRWDGVGVGWTAREEAEGGGARRRPSWGGKTGTRRELAGGERAESREEEKMRRGNEGRRNRERKMGKEKKRKKGEKEKK